MAMVVKNNMSSVSTLNQLNKNSSELAKSLKRVSTGMKINGAGDDASGYSISERMQVRIRGLRQCDDNTTTGKNMINVAEGGVDEQIEIMKKIREIAMKASDDTYSQTDRDILQKEVNQLLMQSNAVSYDTDYNGMPLLSGIVPGKQVPYFDSSAPAKLNTVANIISDAHDTMSGVGILGHMPTGYAYVPTTVYDPNSPTTVYTPMTSVTGLTSGGTIYDAGGTAYPLSVNVANQLTANGQIVVDSNGRDSLGAAVGTSGNFIAHAQGTVYAPIASNTLSVGSTFYASPTGGTLYTYDVEGFTGKGIMKNGAASTGNVRSYELDFTVSNYPNDLDGEGFSLMCNDCGQFVTIRFDAGKNAADSQWIGDTKTNSELYHIGIAGAASAADVGRMILEGIRAASAQSQNTGGGIPNPAPQSPSDGVEITRDHHTLNFYEYDDGSGNKKYYAYKNSSNELELYNGTKGEDGVKGGELPWQNLYIQGDTPASQNTRLKFPNTTLNALFPSEDSTWDTEPQSSDYPNPWPKDFQTLSDADRVYYTEKYHCKDDEAVRREKWRDEIWPYPRKGAFASGSCVRTREKANKFLADVDQAIKYLLDCSTTLGAQAQRMDSMNANIVTAGEMTQASESTIRDADMAKEMVSYTKNNVLQQSAQSMLAQSNQNSSGILSLLQ